MWQIKTRNITQFTSKDLEKGTLVYVHDDSEHSYDGFEFTAYDPEPNSTFHYAGKLNVHDYRSEIRYAINSCSNNTA